MRATRRFRTQRSRYFLCSIQQPQTTLALGTIFTKVLRMGCCLQALHVGTQPLGRGAVPVAVAASRLLIAGIELLSL